MSDDKANDPSTTSLAYDAMALRWDKMATLLAGTEAMREAGTKYLPKHTAESNAAYQARLAVTTLFNLTSLTLKSWVGRPFSDPLKVNEDVPQEINDVISDNIDLEGNSLDVFARRWFEKGLAKAFCHVLVDFPKPPAATDEKRTLADDRAENLRPYWVLIEPERLIFASATIIDGVEVLTHVRYKEEHVEVVGFSEVVKNRIRVLEPGTVTIYEEVENKTISGSAEWTRVDGWETDSDIIPLVTFYADREGFMFGKPPLQDLADLNVSHWQSSSDQRNVLTVARFPILACSGGVEDKEVVIGPHRWLYTSDPNARFYYVEHTGKAIEAGRKDLGDLESQMANYGAEFLRQKPGNPTATARALDSAESTSPLQDVTVRFMDALSTALKYTAEWMGVEKGGTVTVTTDFGPEEAILADYQALVAARKGKDISRIVFNRELKRRGTLGDEFDEQQNEEELEAEAGDLTGSPVEDVGDFEE